MVIGVAVDFATQLIWLRVCPTGNWNGVAGADPVAEITGVSFASLGAVGAPFYGLAGFSAGSDTITANFGGQAFNGATPSGYTAGFPGPGVPSPTLFQVTQAGIEQWSEANPLTQFQATQIGIEAWVSSASQTTMMLATQLGVEEWASVAILGGAKPPSAIMLAGL
jgi:hypothetical protein